MGNAEHPGRADPAGGEVMVPGGTDRLADEGSWLARRPGGAGTALALLAAHPDDETIGAGALIARLRAPALVHLTDGVPRDRRFWPGGFAGDAAAYARVRREELGAALAAAGARGAVTFRLGAADQEAVLALAPLARRLARLLALLRPAVLVTHPYEGGHPDHDAAAFVARAACALLRREGAAPPRLVEMTSYHAEGAALATGRFLPWPGAREGVRRLGAAERARKARMLAAFESQRAVLAPFGAGEERFRPAPPCDLTAPPHPGPLWYERLGFPMTGARWRALAAAAERELRVDLREGLGEAPAEAPA